MSAMLTGICKLLLVVLQILLRQSCHQGNTAACSAKLCDWKVTPRAHLQTYSSMNIRHASSWQPSLNSRASGLPSHTCSRARRLPADLTFSAARDTALCTARSAAATAARGCSRGSPGDAARGCRRGLALLAAWRERCWLPGSLLGHPAAADDAEADVT
jgi:hypothetical protein